MGHMKGDLHPAAVRLSSVLPVVTHRQPERDYKTPTGIGKTRQIRIGRTTYDSLKDAKAALECSFGKIYRMISAGEAEYL